MSELDRLIHEPARLLIVALLSAVKEADFVYLVRESGLTKGNLSSHLVKLEEAGYIESRKEFVRKKPHTTYTPTDGGRAAFAGYLAALERIVQTAGRTA